MCSFPRPLECFLSVHITFSSVKGKSSSSALSACLCQHQHKQRIPTPVSSRICPRKRPHAIALSGNTLSPLPESCDCHALPPSGRSRLQDLMKGFHHPDGSQQALLTGLAHLYNLVPYQRRAQHAGQCGVEVEGRRVPTHDWFLNVQILTSGAFDKRYHTPPHNSVECGIFGMACIVWVHVWASSASYR